LKTVKKELLVTVTATFTAEPLRDSLEFWAEKLGLSLNLEFTALNTVFRQLLDPASKVRQNNGVNFILIRFDDWCRIEEGFENQTASQLITEAKVKRNIDEFVNAMSLAIRQSSGSYIVCINPMSPNFDEINFAELEQLLIGRLNEINGVYPVASSELFEYYPIDDYYDSYTDKIGHMPYKQSYYDVLGTLLFRKLYSLVSLPYKVIVLDCDNTLWKGVWAEGGKKNTYVDESRLFLQRMMLKQYEAGVLLCLCSKNDEKDIEAAFKELDNMVLKPEHFAATRINWQAKSKNIKSLAQQLELGLDSFIFIDDSKAECMEVSYNCPQVLALCLPENDSHIPQYLLNIWAFDRTAITQTDKNRTELYMQNSRRRELQEQAASFEDFLNSLELKVCIGGLESADIQRAHQLSMRVNQFNFTGQRYTEGELAAICASDGEYALAVKASDRFGDYGLIGLMICKADKDMLMLENFMLSCRAFCKGIEHAMLAELGKFALRQNKHSVKVSFAKTEKNRLSLDFLLLLADILKPVQMPPDAYIFSSDVLSRINYNDFASSCKSEQTAPAKESFEKNTCEPANTEIIEQIAKELNTAEKIHTEVVKRNHVKIGRRAEYAAPRNEIEQAVAEIWEQVLEIEKVGINDGLFELGGESIKAIQILSRVREKFDTDISLAVLFEGEITVAKLAQAAQESILGSYDEETLAKELAAIENLTEEELEELLKVQV